MTPTEAAAAEFRTAVAAVESQLRRVIVGHAAILRQVVLSLFAGGHVLLEGVPGLGKTRLAVALAQATGLSFQRIQFTPDLMPADITGTQIVTGDVSGSAAGDAAVGGRAFRFQEGPVFTQILLADEINRATPKTQSALLEAMAEGRVTSARTTYVLPQPFLVVATQNPLEMEGTYPLPEAQLDRFAYKLLLGEPTLEELTAILRSTTGATEPTAAGVLSAERILAYRQLVRAVPTAEPVLEYCGRLVLASRPASALATPLVRRHVRAGASPRGAQAMLLGAKAAALADGRPAVDFTDVLAQLRPALRHRLILGFAARAENVSAEAVLSEIAETIGRS